MTSLLSISWAVVSYRRIGRLSRDKETTIPGLVIELLWHLFVIGSRVLAIAIFTARFQIWLLAVVVIHCVVTVTLMITSKRLMFHQVGDGLVDLVYLVAINTLCVFDSDVRHTRLWYVICHCIMYAENILMAVLWFTFTSTQAFWFKITCMGIILLGYIVGVIFQVIFYLKFHPEKEEIMCCEPCNELHFKVRNRDRR